MGDDYSIYDMDEDRSYYDEDSYDDYYQTWGWRYNLRQLFYRVRFFFVGNFKRCSGCKQRYKNCNCIPF